MRKVNFIYNQLDNKKKAFTLIELLIVIAIIGILFIVLVSKVDFATDKAKATGVQTDFRSFQMAFDTVAKENAGFNTFGFDTGDNAGTIPDGYEFVNEDAKKATMGDGIRNSYDEGDKNLNGKQDVNGKDGYAGTTEVFTGRKIHTEKWTDVWTLVNPADTAAGYDAGAIFALESAINKNLDPKLHITINADGKITMANQARDPWKNEYHGYYITNAEADKGDRGAIVMYSNGANGKWGSAHIIENGIVTVGVPGNNVNGKDDYSFVSCYTFTNGYGEVLNATTGFSNNMAGVGTVGTNNPINQNGTAIVLPAENPTATDLNGYSWSDLKTLAQAKLSKEDYKNKYGINPGSTKTENGTTYVLVDLGLDNGDYDGFVFMYKHNVPLAINSTNTNDGGYAASEIAPQVEELYISLTDSEFQSAIKEITITCNDGYDNSMATHGYTAHMFLASYKEVGFTDKLTGTYATGYNAEGTCFDLFTSDKDSRKSFMKTANLAYYNWWLRTANSTSTEGFLVVDASGNSFGAYANQVINTCKVVPCFVIG